MKEKAARDTAAAGPNAGCETRLVLAVLRRAVVPFSTAALAYNSWSHWLTQAEKSHNFQMKGAITIWLLWADFSTDKWVQRAERRNYVGLTFIKTRHFVQRITRVLLTALKVRSYVLLTRSVKWSHTNHAGFNSNTERLSLKCSSLLSTTQWNLWGDCFSIHHKLYMKLKFIYLSLPV
jgi:hypothetical protein